MMILQEVRRRFEATSGLQVVVKEDGSEVLQQKWFGGYMYVMMSPTDCPKATRFDIEEWRDVPRVRL